MRWMLLHAGLGEVPDALAERFYEELQRREWQRLSDGLPCFYRPARGEDRACLDRARRDVAAAGAEADLREVEVAIAFAEHPPLAELINPWDVP